MSHNACGGRYCAAAGPGKETTAAIGSALVTHLQFSASLTKPQSGIELKLLQEKIFSDPCDENPSLAGHVSFHRRKRDEIKTSIEFLGDSVRFS